MVLVAAADLALPQLTQDQVDVLAKGQAGVGVVPGAVALVRQVGHQVVLVAVDDGVVVHVHAEEKFGRINRIAQEGFGVVGFAVLVLVEIRDKVVVFVEAGKDLAIPARASAQFLGQRYGDALGLADPIRVYVLVVVVIDELKQMPAGVAVVDVAAGVGHEGRSAVVGVQVERLAVGKKRIQRIGRGQVKGLGRFPRGGQLAEPAVYYALEVLVGEPLKAPVDHVLASQIKALEIFDVEIEADQFRGRGQAVLEAEEALV